ncbi:zinc finger matrin-type protein 1 isoform X2 [Leucoraja erinacea]|uniref:zinc finger matrin-type protein 1 isoform X2 n=1 Tax=Leucoraja erinaceus TaxID=7782 RepID=UPI0024587368|nr:zinc finger matrin-type protein 1 isoform X2 [Leucoraja erinacea]
MFDKMGGHDSELFMDKYCKVCCAMLISEVQRTTHYESKKHANKVRFYFQTHKEEGTPLKKIKTENVTVGFQDTGTKVDKDKFCLLCNMVFTSPTAAQFHYHGKVHAKRLKQLVGKQPSVTQPQTVELSITVPTSVASAPPELNTSVQSEESERITQESTEEASATPSTALDQEDPNRYCKLCSASFNNPLMAQQHYIGKKHTKNDTRRQLMDELGKEADSSEKNGNFSCAICNVTLNSIKQYQSHLQGYKHHFKENEVSNLVKNTKSKKYDSFQDELDDFIKVQKARGLVPKVCFRKFEDNPEEEEEERWSFHMDNPLPPAEFPLEVMQGITLPNPSGFHDEQTMDVETEVPQWPSSQGDWPITQSVQRSDFGMAYYTERLPPLKRTCPKHVPDPHSADSADECRPVSSDDSAGSCKKDKRGWKKKRRRVKRNKDAESKRDSEHENYRKEKSVETVGLQPDTNHTYQKPDERDKEELDVSKEKMKHKKDKKDQYIDKEELKQRQKRQKKKKEVDIRTEEEKLWDESILGI